MKPEPIEEFPPVPTQLLWMFDGIDRKQATKMMHDYARSAITWKPSKALLRAWEDVQTATDKARRLEDELKNRDKCSFMGPMRDCPTHGESADLAALRNRLQEIGDLAASSRTGPGLREVLAEIERMSTETPNVQDNRASPASGEAPVDSRVGGAP